MLMWKMRTPTAAVLALSAASCRLRTSVFLAPASAAAREGRSRSSVVGSLLASWYDMYMSPFLVATVGIGLAELALHLAWLTA